MKIYLIGTPFSMVTTGMNGYINAQGFPKVGMMTTILGTVINIILDPVFIFGLDMGVAGAALATVISQILSAVWVLRFLTGPLILIKLEKKKVVLKKRITKEIFKLGMSNFIMHGINCVVRIVCNKTLQTYGGDVYVGIERVKSGIQFNTWIGFVYTMLAWAVVFAFPGFWFGIFSDDLQMISLGMGALKTYFFGFVFMAFQFAGQSTFQALGDAKHAITFSLLRKVIIVVPLTILLPMLGFGVSGVFLAEPISNAVGGLACYVTMRMTMYKKL